MERHRFRSAMTVRFRVRHLGITTMIGCKVACVYCPQDKISRPSFSIRGRPYSPNAPIALMAAAGPDRHRREDHERKDLQFVHSGDDPG